MDTNIYNTLEYQAYRDFWQGNIQKIDEINSLIEKSLLSLEKKHSDFQSLYDELTNRINILSSIYSNYNSISGKEYLLKMRSLLKHYKDFYTRDGINFNVVYYLHSKIIEMKKKNFMEFPKLNHNMNRHPGKNKRIEARKRKPAAEIKYRWITYKRKSSLYISPFTDYSLIEYNKEMITRDNNSGETFLKYNNKKIKIEEPGSLKSGMPDNPVKFLIISQGNRNRCFAVDKTGKRIFSSNDLFTSKIKPFVKTRMFKGYIRLFGSRHIYI